MPTCVIDGKEVEFKDGENLVEIAKSVGIEIPVFCYHPGLTVVAQCRMCAVEIEKMPKLQTACSTSPRDGMVIHTQSENVKAMRESVMEFLLVNHPLDCPICDKAGECDLQDFSYEHGSAHMRYTESRRTYLDLDMGPVIKKNMNRCIHCTRCIRFGDEIANIREMVALQRGNDTEITTLDGRALETDYAGNYADICPTGSLTLKDFRFNKRAWYLTKTPTVCEGCSKGCNMEIHHEGNQIYRCLPRENMEINRYWLCDEGRFNYHYIQDPERITDAQKGGNPTTWDEAIQEAKSAAQGGAAVLVGTDLPNEEIEMIQKFVSAELKGASIFHFGTDGISNTKDDGPEDQILKMKSKTANLNGAEKLGIKAFSGDLGSAKVALVFRGGRAQLPKLGVPMIGVGVFMNAEAKGSKVILPGASFAEKNGTVVNHQGIAQKFQRSVLPPEGCKDISEILMIWMQGKKKETPKQEELSMMTGLG